MPTLLAAFDLGFFLERVFKPDELLWQALWKTVYISVAAQIIGTLLGTMLALWGMSRFRILRGLSFVYTLLFRGTPVIVQIFFIVYGSGLLLGFELFPREMNFGLFTLQGVIVAGIAALALNEGAYMAEIIRAGVNSIDRGQFESGLSVGMRRGQVMRRIIMPQAARVIVPGLGNEFNNMLKTSSLLTFVGVYELFQDAQVANSTSYKPAEVYAAVAIWYLLLTTIWTMVQIQIERRLGVSERAEAESWIQKIFGSAPERGVSS